MIIYIFYNFFREITTTNIIEILKNIDVKIIMMCCLYKKIIVYLEFLLKIPIYSINGKANKEKKF